jgi:hypothetical protein
MGESRLYPSVADQAPSENTLTGYDERHLITYVDLLEAEADGADWDEAALLVLHIDPISEPLRARQAWESHLARAKWMTEHGYQLLLQAPSHAPSVTVVPTGNLKRLTVPRESVDNCSDGVH